MRRAIKNMHKERGINFKFAVKNFIKRIFGSAGEKKLAVYRTRLPQINALAEGLQAATDDDLRAAFADLRRRPKRRRDR